DITRRVSLLLVGEEIAPRTDRDDRETCARPGSAGPVSGARPGSARPVSGARPGSAAPGSGARPRRPDGLRPAPQAAEPGGPAHRGPPRAELVRRLEGGAAGGDHVLEDDHREPGVERPVTFDQPAGAVILDLFADIERRQGPAAEEADQRDGAGEGAPAQLDA